jgi:hypothetical protein
MRPAILAVAAVFASQVASAQVRHGAFPTSLSEKWSQDPHRCKTSDDPIIVLSAKTYATSKMNCTIHWVSEIPGTRGPIYSARMQCSSTAGGADKAISNTIVLPIDSDHILVGPTFSDLKGYERCSTNESMPSTKGRWEVGGQVAAANCYMIRLIRKG